MQMPVGVFDPEGFFGITALEFGRYLGADVRHADQQRHRTLLQSKNFVNVTHVIWPLKTV